MTFLNNTFFVTVLLVLLVCLALILLWIMIWDSNRFVVKKYEFTEKKLKKDCRIIFLSDLHNKEYGMGNERLLAEIDAQRPDLILMGGDMMTAKPGASFEKAAAFVKKCAEKYPVYYAMGNHEYRAGIYPDVYGTLYGDYRKALEGVGITFLDNESCYLPEYRIRLTGLTIERYYYKRFVKREMKKGYLQETIGPADTSAVQILLAHNPEFFPDYAGWQADLVLSGHMHGGVVRVPFLGGLIAPSLKPFPHYDGGLYEESGSRMIISRGLGMHTIPVRVFNPGEVIVMELKREKESG